MQVNSAEALALGRAVHEAFGSWQEARKAAVWRDGVYVIDPVAMQDAKDRKAVKAA